MTRVGLLTGGGDCPGLNAVIRGVVRRGLRRRRAQLARLPPRLGGRAARRRRRAGRAEHRRHPAPRRHDPRHLAHQPLRRRSRRHGRRQAHARGPRDRRADPDRRRGHARRRAAPARRRRADRGRAEDDRQRPRRHRRDVRLPDRRPDRDRRDRPPAHDRRVPRPRDGGRGDGQARGLDRHPRRDRRRRGRDPGARAAVRHRRGRRPPAAPPRARAQLLDRRRRRGGHPAGGHAADPRQATGTDAFGHARLGGIGVVLEQEIERPHGLRVAGHDPRPRPARWHAGGLRPRARHPLRGRRHRGRRRRALRADGRAARAPQIVEVPLAEALREPKLLDPALYETAELFFG